jgi:hypothetical protein
LVYKNLNRFKIEIQSISDECGKGLGYRPDGGDKTNQAQKKHTLVKIVKSEHSKGKHLSRQCPQIDKYNRSSIYRMKCMDCPLKYVDQTGRTYNTRYKEHIHDIRSNNSNTGYANHIQVLNTGHTYGTITDTMEIIKTGRKRRYLNTIEKYHIYEICKNNLHMNDTGIDIHNPIFKTLHRIYTK